MGLRRKRKRVLLDSDDEEDIGFAKRWARAQDRRLLSSIDKKIVYARG